jgi:hypothetical protein
MNDDDTDMNPDNLDNLLRESLRAEAPPRQLARLEQFCRRRSRAERRGRRVRWAVALAATVLAAASLSIWLQRDESARQVARPDRVEPDPSELPPPDAIAALPDDARSPSAGRAPTAYERLVFAVCANEPLAVERPSVAERIDALLESVARDPDGDVGQRVDSCGVARADLERLLWPELTGPNDEHRHLAVRLLAVCGTPRSVSGLLQLSRQESFRDEALDAVRRIVGVAGLAGTARETPDRRVRAAILARLVRADSEEAARGFLALTADESLRDEALAAADAAGPSFVSALLDLLDDDDKAVRRAAALVIGHVNGPEITQSLIARVTNDPGRSTETWMALLACRGERVKEFLVLAMSSPRMLGRVNCARVEWARMIP